jgi:hypothetical protein
LLGLSIKPSRSAAVSWLRIERGPVRNTAAHNTASRGGSPVNVA